MPLTEFRDREPIASRARRISGVLGSLYVQRALGVLALLVSAAATASGQAADSDHWPRTAWGAPDLRGTWTTATLTPLERPISQGSKAELTPAEAEEMERQIVERRALLDGAAPQPGSVGGYNQVCPATDVHRMRDRVLRSMVRQVMRSGAPQVSFGWQGGEPTLCGLDFFRRAVAYQRRYGLGGQRVANAIQTNGLLLDDAWAEFLRESNFLVGLSIDGPPG